MKIIIGHADEHCLIATFIDDDDVGDGIAGSPEFGWKFCATTETLHVMII